LEAAVQGSAGAWPGSRFGDLHRCAFVPRDGEGDLGSWLDSGFQPAVDGLAGGVGELAVLVAGVVRVLVTDRHRDRALVGIHLLDLALDLGGQGEANTEQQGDHRTDNRTQHGWVLLRAPRKHGAAPRLRARGLLAAEEARRVAAVARLPWV